MTNYTAGKILALLGLTMLGCVGGGGGDDSAPNQPADSQSNSTTTAWSASASTTGVPTYGKNCRYAADSIYTASSKQGQDDALKFIVTESGAKMSMDVNEGSGSLLSVIDIQFDQGLKDKSYRKASGSALWGMPQKAGEVVDGTFCFSSKLGTSDDIQAEFSLVMKLDDGSYESLSGGITIPPGTLSSGLGTVIDSGTLNINL